jgi:hypothetical protein
VVRQFGGHNVNCVSRLRFAEAVWLPQTELCREIENW